MYQFYIRSADGESIKEIDDLSQFAVDWLDGSFLTLSNEGLHVTPDGISIITPADDETQRAISHRALAESLRTNMPMSHNDLYTSTTLLDRDQLIQLVAAAKMPKGNDFYIDTEEGRTFAIMAKNLVASRFTPSEKMLEDIGLGKGAIYLADTLVIEDKMSGVLFVTDTRKEAESITDMIHRQLEKGLVIEAAIELSEGYNDDGLYGHMRISGDPKLTTKALASLEEKSLGKEDEFFVIQKGYANSSTNPLTQEQLTTLAYKQNLTTMSSKDKATGNINILTIDNKMTNAAGSQERGFWTKFEDNIPTYVHQGNQLCITSNQRGESVVEMAHNIDLDKYEKSTHQKGYDDPLGIEI